MSKLEFKNKNSSTTDEIIYKKKIKSGIVDTILLGIPMALKQRTKREKITDKINYLIYPQAKAPFWFYHKKNKAHYVVMHGRKHPAASIEGSLQGSLIHEHGHSLFTDMDINKISKKMKKNNVPFKYVNIFEDMRIEHLLSSVFLDGEAIFKYTQEDGRLEEIKSEDALSVVLFKILDSQNLSPGKLSNPYSPIVETYYKKAISAKNTNEVAEIAIEFYNTYRDTLKEEEREGKQAEKEETKRKKESSLFDKMMDDSEEGDEEREKEEREKEGKEKEGKDFKSSGDLVYNSLPDEEKDKIIQESEHIDFQKEASTLTLNVENSIQQENGGIVEEESNCANLIDLESTKTPEVDSGFITKTQKIYDILRKMLIPKRITVVSHNQSSDIEADSAIEVFTGIDFQKAFWKKETERVSKTPSLHILYDCSGSMFGKPNQNGKQILTAFNQFAQEKLISAKVTFTAQIHSTNYYQTVELPVGYKAIHTVKTPGWEEGLATALNESIKHKSLNKDFIFFFTDGHISEYDEAELKKIFSNNPVLSRKSVGIYLGDFEFFNREVMEDIFGQNIIVGKDLAIVAKSIVETAQKGVAPKQQQPRIGKKMSR